MSAATVTFDELLRHNEEETERWHRWFQAHPEVLDLKMELAQMHDVRGVLVHIFAVELLYTERMVSQARSSVSPADFPSSSVDELFGIGAQARAKFRQYLETWGDDEWNKAATFQTLSAGTQSASRRKCFTHALLHSVRHWAQLATALRQQGFKQDWGHDFLFSKAMA